MKTHCPHACIDPCTPECVNIRKRLDELEAREPLVLEVIRLFRAWRAATRAGARNADALDHELTVETCKLAEWKP